MAEKGATWGSSAWGRMGAVHSSFPSWEWPQHKLFTQAFSEMGRDIPLLREANDGTGVGVGWVPNTLDPSTQTRSSAKTAYYDPVAERKNLHLLTATKVQRIVFDGTIAREVVVQSRNEDRGSGTRVSAQKEIVLAAGPVFSPNILQRSGVGPRKIVEEAKVGTPPKERAWAYS